MGFALCHTGELLFSVLKLKYPPEKNQAYGLYYMSIALFLGACEVVYRILLKKWRRFPQQPLMVTYDFVEQEIAQGRKLVVFEDRVLDIAPYAHLHPCPAGILDTFVGRA